MCTMEAIAEASDGEISPRKSNKPLMEKRRRQRINRCLNDLKALVLEALKKDPSRYSKLEKADILEMTVRHIQALHRHESANGGIGRYKNVHPTATDEKAKYRAGFHQCAVEVTRYLSSITGVPTDLHSKINSHLSSISNSFPSFHSTQQTNGIGRIMIGASAGTVVPPITTVPTTTVVSTAADSSTVNASDSSPNNQENREGQAERRISGNPSLVPLKSVGTPVEAKASVTVGAGVTLVPARLANGQMALVLPPGTSIPVKNHNQTPESLSYSNNTIQQSTDRKEMDDSIKNQAVDTSSGNLGHHYTNTLSSLGMQEVQNNTLGSSSYETVESHTTTHSAAFKQYQPTNSSSVLYNKSHETQESSMHSEIYLQTATPNKVNESYQNKSTMLPYDRNPKEGAFSPSKDYLSQAEVPYEGMRLLHGHVAVSVTRQDSEDISVPNTSRSASSQTVLIKPKPQLPAGVLFLRNNPTGTENSMNCRFDLSGTASPGTDFTSHFPSNHEPLNLVVSEEEQKHQGNIYNSESPAPLLLPPQQPSSSQSQTSQSSFSASSPTSPAFLPQSSPPSQLQLHLSSPSPSTVSELVTPQISQPNSSSSPQMPSSSSTLKAPSSCQIRRRVTPYENPRKDSNREGSPWRPW